MLEVRLVYGAHLSRFLFVLTNIRLGCKYSQVINALSIFLGEPIFKIKAHLRRLDTNIRPG
jgi:hypothetical protein